MLVESQHDIIALLENPATYGADAGPVERIETHISEIFLVGERAYKLKRAVKFDYLDFSTVERRREACAAEVRVNRRTAPQIYLGVRPIVRTPEGNPALDGAGEPIDWVVEMARFDQDTLFDRLAAGGDLDTGLMRVLAGEIARFHADADPRPDHGGLEGLAWVIRGNTEELLSQAETIFDRARCEDVDRRSRAALERDGTLLEARRADGHVRQCHGDLHLRNICLVDGRPTLFDAIEFNDEIACVDVLYDLAFLLMDLIHRRLRPHANIVLNEYLRRTVDLEGLTLLPLFLSCRAAVRAKVDAAIATTIDDRDRAERKRDEAREYLDMAVRFLDDVPPRILAVGGFSGSGKSTLAERLAPEVGDPPGAVVLRSDVTRKTLLGSPIDAPLDAAGYAKAVSDRVYGALIDRAVRTARAGHTAIVDAVFADPARRAGLEAAAARLGVPFLGLWLDAPPAVMASRIRQRRGDASDATVDVLDAQVHRGAGELSAAWQRIDAGGDLESIALIARQRIGAVTS